MAWSKKISIYLRSSIGATSALIVESFKDTSF